MNQLTLWSVVVGVALAGLYAVKTMRKTKKKPEFSKFTNIVLSTVGAGGAIRVMCFAIFTKDFGKSPNAAELANWYSLSGEDAIFLFIGGLALAWVSIEQIWECLSA